MAKIIISIRANYFFNPRNKFFQSADIILTICRVTSVNRFPRYLKDDVLTALKDTPVVLLHGPRQSGKTTLAKEIGAESGYAYLTFDDSATLAYAESDPTGFVADLPEKSILDEVQRAPRLFSELKLSVDENRQPGRFILTGSSNVLLAPKLSDSLAGRLEILNLHPLTQCEIEGTRSDFLEQLLKGKFRAWEGRRLGKNLVERIAAGGFPSALAREDGKRRMDWYCSYVDSLIQRDIRDISRIHALDAIPKLLRAAADQTGRIFNVSKLSAPLELSRPTIKEYSHLLELIFLVDFVRPWSNSKLNRLIKSPKIHLKDSGLALALMGGDEGTLARDRNVFGQLLETFVYQELRRLASWQSERLDFYHYRDRDGDEVDLVIEQGAIAVMGVEVKATSTLGSNDFKGLRKLREAVGKKFLCGVVLYDGNHSHRFEEGLYAVPISTLWASKSK